MREVFGSNKPKSEKEQERLHDKVDTIVGAGTLFVGDIHVKGTLRIDGRVEGKVISSGDVVVGETGALEAEVRGRSIKLAGTLKGNAFASGTLELASTGKLYGDIEVGKVVISDGAVFQGQCKMHSPEVTANKKD
ncbi:MAG: polymer-forming cytoskeletal protein [Firmicutes bacterium]|nr:polymer-forming cytoskeletal protein [Dethiobacter sp.]MBS3888849.1 polymer-forming cytoskeletal protein [Bacillota bacterium]MBS4054946.1 polymer-forming cytoskeletal protein [Thermaerobacter sp.]